MGEQTAETVEPVLADMLAELQAIRALLEARQAEENLCPHGGRGFCMSCVMPQIEYTLSVLTTNITNQAWEAMRRG